MVLSLSVCTSQIGVYENGYVGSRKQRHDGDDDNDNALINNMCPRHPNSCVFVVIWFSFFIGYFE